MTNMYKAICTDGREITLKAYINPEHERVIVINSALGVKQNFYEDFALYIFSKGFNVITWDPRGIGLSAFKNPKKDSARLREWGEFDFDAVLRFVNSNLKFDWKNIEIIGHSAGGHLVGLSKNFANIPKLNLISSGTCYWKLYPLSQQPRILLSWHFLVPTILKLYGFIPKKFGLGHDIPTGVAVDWRNWSLKSGYLFSDTTLDLSGYEQFKGEIRAIGFNDDLGFSPPATTLDLLSYFPLAKKDYRFFDPNELGLKSIGHFSFFKKKKFDQILDFFWA
jgi:predicted alpha/beta hydrolase